MCFLKWAQTFITNSSFYSFRLRQFYTKLIYHFSLFLLLVFLIFYFLSFRVYLKSLLLCTAFSTFTDHWSSHPFQTHHELDFKFFDKKIFNFKLNLQNWHFELFSFAFYTIELIFKHCQLYLLFTDCFNSRSKINQTQTVSNSQQ